MGTESGDTPAECNIGFELYKNKTVSFIKVKEEKLECRYQRHSPFVWMNSSEEELDLHQNET